MTQENISKRNMLFRRIKDGDVLPLEDRLWLSHSPIYSTRYGDPYVIADMLPLEPSREVAITIHCIHADPQHPIIPTFTIPFETGGYLKLGAVVGSDADFSNMRKSTKLSFRMAPDITAILRCKSESGLLMISYQGWLPDGKPIPMWWESIKCDRFAMKKMVLSDNMIQYGCCGSDMSLDNLNDPESFNKFEFLLNW